MDILQVKNLSFSYPNADKKAVNDLSFSIPYGSFTTICGESGCGKSTLLKLIKKELAPNGEKFGEINFCGTDIEALEREVSVKKIGFVGQNPDEQIVTDKVWHELAFGLENLGENSESIRRKIGEMASYFGIQGWYHKNTDELSGGQKQILNLASVIVMTPELLLLDEPTSQLDPIASENFINTLKKLNEELGITILIVEHRLEELFKVSDNVIALENGKLLFNGSPYNLCCELKDHKLAESFPTPSRVWGKLKVKAECPITVKQGKQFLNNNFYDKKGLAIEKTSKVEYEPILKASNIWFRYEKNSDDVIKDMEITLGRGEIFSILGGNGAGKTTAVNILSGLDKPYRGSVLIKGKKISKYKGNSLYRKNLAVLPQNPILVFTKELVKDDLLEILKASDTVKDDYSKKIDKISKQLGIAHLLDKHPYDLSGGEQQKCALAKVLLTQPDILILDEPTKGMDAYYKNNLANLLKQMKKGEISLLIVTHDIEFSAMVSDRCALFFDGKLISQGTPNEFFSENTFYTTSASRMSKGFFKNAVLCDEVVQLCK